MPQKTNRSHHVGESSRRAASGVFSGQPNGRRGNWSVSASRWFGLIPVGQWGDYELAMEAIRAAGIRFLMGGGFGLAAYTGRWRNTKDIDLYILPRDREAMISVLSGAGFVDYFEQRPYDPGWIYRSVRGSVIVDVIWSMANRKAEVDELWFERAPRLTLHEEAVQVVPAEELLWCKLYILQRDHCDWPDLFNLLYAVGARLDWDHLLRRVDADAPLLQAVLTVYNWMCPKRAAQLPEWLRKQFGLVESSAGAKDCRKERIRLLDSRNWFAAFQPIEKPLEV
jgi:hypothetical protein